jgi:hypothetical protein
MASKRGIQYNDSGYLDLTAYEAIKKIQKEEKRKLKIELSLLANKRGYKIVAIELKELED